MNRDPWVTIIIPLYIICQRFFDDFLKYNKLKYKNFDIIVIADKKVELPKLSKVNYKYLLTGKRNTGPAEKRDLALEFAKGEICAFIDDDAYPDAQWLKEAVKWFRNPDIVAVGGPGVTPPEDSYSQKISGYILESYLCSGGTQNRFYVDHSKGFDNIPSFVVDWPAYNLLVRTKTLKKIGGYGSNFYGGEDTLLCLKLIKYGRIIYDPQVLVYHHRRKFPFELIKQISGVGLHRGYFFKRYPQTSRSVVYLLPTSLTVGLVIWLVLSVLWPGIFLFPFIVTLLGLYILGFLSVKKHHLDILASLISSLGIIMIHISYGVVFVKGLLTKKLLR